MLGSLQSKNVVGLALVPGFLRHPIGFHHPFVSPADFRNARIRILPSHATASLMRALGATPVEISNSQIGFQVAKGHVDGEELAMINNPGGSVITGNVTFFGKALTLFADDDAYLRLTDRQRQILLAAAASTVRYAVGHNPTDHEVAQTICFDDRRVVLASAESLAALERAAGPVYAQLEADPTTKRYIEQIRAWKTTTAQDPPVVVRRACKRPTSPATVTGRSARPSVLNGTYRWELTAADARANGQNPEPSGTPMIGTAVLRNGTWQFSGSSNDRGTYAIRGDRIRFDWPNTGSVLVFAYTRDGNGTLHLKPVLPMDPGDQFVSSYKAWRRIGPATQLRQ